MEKIEVWTEDCKLRVGAETLVATKVFANPGQEPSVISFHGFGITAGRMRIRYLLDYLATHGISSACFDFSGNGESSHVQPPTLRLRIDQALAAAKQLGRRQGQLALIGTSMGGFIAALLAPELRPRSLILISPAAYSESAMGLVLNEDFPHLARAAGCFVDSPAFEALSTFKGELLIIAAERDAVLPKGVIDRYAESAPRAVRKKVIRLDTAEHKISLWLQDHEEERFRVLREVLNVTREEIETSNAEGELNLARRTLG